MGYHATPPKPDLIFNEKFIYVCQTRGCGADISEFPAAEKDPAPKWCKTCISIGKEGRAEIENEYNQKIK